MIRFSVPYDEIIDFSQDIVASSVWVNSYNLCDAELPAIRLSGPHLRIRGFWCSTPD